MKKLLKKSDIVQDRESNKENSDKLCLKWKGYDDSCNS